MEDHDQAKKDADDSEFPDETIITYRGSSPQPSEEAKRTDPIFGEDRPVDFD